MEEWPGMPNHKDELVQKLADEIEEELRDLIMKGPHPSLTSLIAFCSCCWDFKHRKEICLVQVEGDELPFCRDCMKKKGRKESDSMEAMEYQARTIAIMRIRGLIK
ncbi:hypothetical protein [Lihuaxuella thermophila]|uniref:Uncharacterized protein n=1 Tax=Lihuaxuella thermophila TaxID=1173111 RepID=A0A1H8IFF6_9BACL|nr:hypothetical protein [Lihuaxuella thermophila]SEN66972.1 hypothetical protein SAMN05444955_11754 [Lihuaxuella thermophila]